MNVGLTFAEEAIFQVSAVRVFSYLAMALDHLVVREHEVFLPVI